MPTVYHEDEQDIYGELTVMRRRIDDLERSARRWAISQADGTTIVTGDFNVTGTASFGSFTLEVGGGPVRAIEVVTFGDQVSDASLTTTELEVIDITLTPPSWAEEMLVVAVTNSQLSASIDQNLITKYKLDGGTGFAGAEMSHVSGKTGNMSNPTSIVESAVSLPTAFDLEFFAHVSTSTNASNSFRMDGYVFWMRAA